MSHDHSGITSHKYAECPHWGTGGNYVADPVTGIRTRIAVTPAVSDAAASDDQTPADTAADASSVSKPMKEKKHA